MDNVEQVIRSFHAAGLYTHVYVACGFLNQKDLVFESKILPDEKSIFDLASLTKAFVTTPLVLRECFQRPAGENATLGDVFGDLAGGAFGQDIKKLTAASMLRHETGLPAWRNFYVECEGHRQTLFSAVQRAQDIGASNKDLYSDVGFIILGQMLERQSKKSLASLWSDFLAEIDAPNKEQLGSSQSR